MTCSVHNQDVVVTFHSIHSSIHRGDGWLDVWGNVCTHTFQTSPWHSERNFHWLSQSGVVLSPQKPLFSSKNLSQSQTSVSAIVLRFLQTTSGPYSGPKQALFWAKISLIPGLNKFCMCLYRPFIFVVDGVPSWIVERGGGLETRRLRRTIRLSLYRMQFWSLRLLLPNGYNGYWCCKSSNLVHSTGQRLWSANPKNGDSERACSKDTGRNFWWK